MPFHKRYPNLISLRLDVAMFLFIFITSVFQSAYGRGGGAGTAPVVSLSATSLTFTAQAVGTSSTAQSVTLKNTGSAALTITSIKASGDFSQTNTWCRQSCHWNREDSTQWAEAPSRKAE